MILNLNALPIVQLRNDTIVCSPEIVVVGAAVKVAFTAWSDTLSLPVFELDNEK